MNDDDDDDDDDDDGDDGSSSDPCYRSGPELDEAFIASQPSKRQAWLRSLRRDPIKRVADFVRYVRASDSRKQDFAGSSGTVPRMIPSYTKLHHYSSSDMSGLDGTRFTLCSNVSAFFER